MKKIRRLMPADDVIGILGKPHSTKVLKSWDGKDGVPELRVRWEYPDLSLVVERRGKGDARRYHVVKIRRRR